MTTLWRSHCPALKKAFNTPGTKEQKKINSSFSFFFFLSFLFFSLFPWRCTVQIRGNISCHKRKQKKIFHSTKSLNVVLDRGSIQTNEIKQPSNIFNIFLNCQQLFFHLLSLLQQILFTYKVHSSLNEWMSWVLIGLKVARLRFSTIKD